MTSISAEARSSPWGRAAAHALWNALPLLALLVLARLA
jgi:hypothetical protein